LFAATATIQNPKFVFWIVAVAAKLANPQTGTSVKKGKNWKKEGYIWFHGC